MEGNYDRRTYQDNEDIFVENDRAGEAYLIVSGEVRLHKVVNGEVSEIDTIGPGQIFGEMGVISDMNRMASATAVGETVVTACHRRVLNQKVDMLHEDSRDAIRFMIVYCQEFLPFELMENRPIGPEAQVRDKTAFELVRAAEKPGALDGLDAFLAGLFKVLVSYTKRRLPPDFKG